MLPMHYITKYISEKAITYQNPCSSITKRYLGFKSLLPPCCNYWSCI